MKRLLLVMSLMTVLWAETSVFAQMGRENGPRRENRERMSLLDETGGERGQMDRKRLPLPFRGPGMPDGCPGMKCGTAGSSPVPLQGSGPGMKCGMQGGPGKGMAPGGCPMMAYREKAKGLCHLMFAVMVLVHILLAIWVYKDIRKRNSENGVWIVIALLTGLLGTAVYALICIGESKK